MSRALEGKVILLTGASGGIGEATALAVAEAGAKVVIGDMLIQGEDVAAAIRKKGGQAVFLRTDVSKKEEVQRLVDTAVSEFGRLDGAFNNAAIFKSVGRTGDVPDEIWDADIAVNLTGVFYCVRAEINQMLKQGGGSIVNTASAAGLVGFRLEAPYTASKHGVIGLTKAAALEYALDKIRVNALCPGVVDTPMIRAVIASGAVSEENFVACEPMGRMGKPSELAGAVVFLLSDAASFVTGISMPVDGGFVAQ